MRECLARPVPKSKRKQEEEKQKRERDFARIKSNLEEEEKPFRGILLKGLAAEYMTSWGKGAAAERYPHRSCLQPEGAERKRKDCSD
jgi:hypothetical protein